MTMIRMRYCERQRLRKADLNGEQAYRIDLRRRHNIAHHTWGIVRGLELHIEGRDLLINPGIAVDGFGRELIVEQGIRLTSADLDEAFEGLPDKTWMKVWLLYASFANGDRWHESVKLRLTPADEPELLESYAQLRDDPEAEWPVLLGKLRNKSVGYDIKHCWRYANLVGSGVTGASGRASFRLRPRQFVVSIKDDKEFTDRLVIDQCDSGPSCRIYGDLYLSEPLKLDGGAVGIGFRAIEPEDPPRPRAWQVYRTLSGQAPNQRDELVIALYHPGQVGNPADYRLMVGSAKTQLTVKADGSVVIHGNLYLEGALLIGPSQPDVDEPSDAPTPILASLKIVTLTLEDLERLYNPQGTSRLGIAVAGPDTVEIGQDVDYTITVTNTGQVALSDVVVTLQPVFNGTPETAVSLERIPILAAGQSHAFTYRIRRDSAGLLTLFASAGSIDAQKRVTDQRVTLKHIQITVGG